MSAYLFPHMLKLFVFSLEFLSVPPFLSSSSSSSSSLPPCAQLLRDLMYTLCLSNLGSIEAHRPEPELSCLHVAAGKDKCLTFRFFPLTKPLFDELFLSERNARSVTTMFLCV